MDRPADGLAVDKVLVDNRAGARRAVRHLLDQGHRRIGYLGDREDIWTIQERYAGFYDAFADVGTEPDPRLVRHGRAAGQRPWSWRHHCSASPIPRRRCSQPRI